jgi:signal transduction histidine kinase
MPILRLCRIYCVLAVAAALVVSICIFLNYRLWNELGSAPSGLVQVGLSSYVHSSRLGYFLSWGGFVLLAGAVVYAFKIARQTGIDAGNSSHLLQEAEQRTLEIAALYDTSQDVSVQHDLSVLLKTILERARKMLSAAGCAVFLYDAEHDDFQITVEVGVGMPIGTRLPHREGLAGRVAETQEPLIVNDYPNWPFRSKVLQQLPIAAAVCVPMVRGGELIGVLGVHEVEGTNRRFTEAEARLLSLFADDAAGALHNARLLEELRNSEERFRIAAECASDIVYDWDLLEDHVDYFGALFEKTRANGGALARTRREYWELIHPEDRARVEEALKSHFETGRTFSEEYRISDGKNSYISVADRATAIRNSAGKPVRLIGAVSDITERKHAEQMKTDFVSFVTHQLRTPLSGVKWMLELATEAKENPEEVQSFVWDARVSTERLIGLVNDLLDVSRLERGKLQVSCQPIDLAALTRDVVGEMTPLFLEKKQAISVQADEKLAKPSADVQLLRQALLNLVSNALKYTPAKGKIAIQLRQEADRILWRIKDNGIGIPRPDLGKLFEKFYRAGNALSVETEGTGLGLYLVRLIVERFGGNVSCESEEGVGSTFLLTLPLHVKEV